MLPRRPRYSESEEHTWTQLYTRHWLRVERVGCRPFIDGMHQLGIRAHRIPTLRSVSDRLRHESQWSLVHTDRMMPVRVFFQSLANRRLPVADTIRGPGPRRADDMPDVFGSLFGQAPLLTHPAYGHFLQRLGAASIRADEPGLMALTRVYWCTVKLGLVRDRAALKVFGSSLMSDSVELARALRPRTYIHSFDLDAMAGRPIDCSDARSDYYEMPSFEELALYFERWAIGRDFFNEARPVLPPALF